MVSVSTLEELQSEMTSPPPPVSGLHSRPQNLILLNHSPSRFTHRDLSKLTSTPAFSNSANIFSRSSGSFRNISPSSAYITHFASLFTTSFKAGLVSLATANYLDYMTSILPAYSFLFSSFPLFQIFLFRALRRPCFFN